MCRCDVHGRYSGILFQELDSYFSARGSAIFSSFDQGYHKPMVLSLMKCFAMYCTLMIPHDLHPERSGGHACTAIPYLTLHRIGTFPVSHSVQWPKVTPGLVKTILTLPNGISSPSLEYYEQSKALR